MKIPNWYKRLSDESKQWDHYEKNHDLLFVQTGASYRRPRHIVWFDNLRAATFWMVIVVIFILIASLFQK